MVDIIFHPEAQEEYEEALAWYQSRSARAARRFEAELEHLLELIQLNPQSFPPYDDEHRFAVLRRYPYTLIYQVVPNSIHIIAVAQAESSTRLLAAPAELMGRMAFHARRRRRL